MLNKILKVLIYLIVFLIPVFFLPFSFEVLEFNKLYILFFLVWLSVLLWLLKMIVRDKEIRIRVSLIDYLVLAFVAVSIISSIFSVDKLSSIFGYYGRFSTGLAGTLSFAAFYFLVVNNLGRSAKSNIKSSNLQKEVRPRGGEGEGIVSVSGIIKTLIYSAAVVIIFAYFSLFGLWAKIAQIGPGAVSIIGKIALRVSPAGLTAQSMAMFLVVMLILAVFVILRGQEWSGFSPAESIEEKKKKSNGKAFRIFCGIFVFLSFILLMVTDYTPAWVILTVGLVALVAIILKKRILKNEVHQLIIPIALVIVSILFMILNFRGLAGGLVTNNANLYYNFMPERNLSQGESWETALNTTTGGFKNALIGSGPGTFSYAFSKYKPISMNEGGLWAIRFDRSGNVFAEVLVMTGVLGFLSLIALIGAVFLAPSGILARLFNKKAAKNSKFKLDHGTSFLMIVFAAIILVHFSYYQTLVLGFLFWLFAAMIVGWRAEQLAGGEWTFAKTIRFRSKDFMEMALVTETLLIVLSLAFIVVGFFGIKFYLADAKYVMALNNPELDGKIIALQEAIKLNPRQVRYQMVLSKVFLAKAQEGLAAERSGETEQEIIENIKLAQMFAMNATQITPQQISTWQSLADLYQKTITIAQDSKQFANLTIDALTRASELEPRNPDIYTQIGNMYLFLGQRDEAKKSFNKAIQQKIDYIPANTSLALIEEGEGNIEGATKKLEWLASLYPTNADVLFQLGRMYYNQNEIEKAVKQFLAALTTNPNHSNSLYSLGIAYEKQGRVKEAIGAFEAVLALNPNVQEVKDRIARLKQPTE
ncbi:tetratricopeptide repeat protein [Patescibacteria group bacterium]|nr:tetratricopeptide repeat protein [Patescibacteria group bacterium]